MSTRREILTGIIAALISAVILGGSLVLATLEDQSTVAMVVTRTPTLTGQPTRIILVTQRPGEPTYTPSPTPRPSQTPKPEQPVTCPSPPGWNSIIVQSGDTLDSLAQTYNTTPNALAQANCLVSSNLIPGSVFYVPGPPPPTPVPCGPPSGWVYYIVQPGDTLYSISRKFGTTVAQLQVANCMGSSTSIRVGQKLYVPYVPTAIPSYTPTFTVTPSPEPSATPTEIPPTLVPTTALPSVTPDGPTATLTPTSTATPEPPTATPTNTPTNTSTPTPSPTNTPTPTSTPTWTFTPVPINTNTPTPTSP